MNATRLLQRFVVVAALSALVAQTAQCGAASFQDRNADTDLKKVLLTEPVNWQAVLDTCGDYDEATSPVIRAVMGHAHLALNNNDESLRLFLSIGDNPDRTVWQGWAKAESDRVCKDAKSTDANKALAKYLEGDAMARLGLWDNAARCYGEATAFDTQFALGWNALGVAWMYRKKGPDSDAIDNGRRLDEARNCFEKARDRHPTFADAHANLGIYYLMIEGADTAIEEFTEAIKHSKGRHSLACVGRACAVLGKNRNKKGLEIAAKDFKLAAQCSWVRPVAEANVKQLERAGWKSVGDEESTGGAKGAGFNARVEARKVFDTLNATPGQGRTQALGQIRGNYSSSEWRSIQQQAGKNGRWSNGFAAIFGGSRISQQNKATGEIGGVAGVPGAAGYAKFGGERSSSMTLRPFGQSGNHGKLWGMMSGSQRGPGGAGGATTEGLALEEALGDIGVWPTKSTWFGVAPKIALPAIKAF